MSERVKSAEALAPVQMQVGCTLGIVVIGRNEGERLQTCFLSVAEVGRCVVFVDSGSTVDSLAVAAAMGIECVALDLHTPFTAARARNAGFDRLSMLCPDLRYVQFIDGDCEIAPHWLTEAVKFLDSHAQVAVVCGRRKERFPDRSVYNRLCDIEWNIPVGQIRACGGDALMRAEVIEAIGGYNPALIAGEEPELCVRLRQAGWKIWCIDQPMTMHDAAMLRFGQWWKRSKRSGHAFAEGAALHGTPPERHWVRESRSAVFWGLCIPMLVILGSALIGPMGFILLFVYPLQVARIGLRGQRGLRDVWPRAFYLILGKFPEMIGVLTYLWHRWTHKQAILIEYK